MQVGGIGLGLHLHQFLDAAKRIAFLSRKFVGDLPWFLCEFSTKRLSGFNARCAPSALYLVSAVQSVTTVFPPFEGAIAFPCT